jgi:hypothetical protein
MSKRLVYPAATLALAAIALGYFLVQRQAARPGPHLGPRPAAARPVAPPPAPTARMLLNRADDLALTQGQKARLEALDRQWKAESAGLDAALRQEQEAFSRFMQEAEKRGKTSVQEIQGRSADLRDLSETLRARRQHHAEAAVDVLTEKQREMLSSPEPSTRHGGA